MPHDSNSTNSDDKFYGRRKGVRLSARQSQLIDTHLAAIRTSIDNPILDMRKPCWLEIGFGGGEHLAFQAMENPDVDLIGAEPFVNGVAKLLVAIDDNQLKNVRIHDGDARTLLGALPDQSISRLFLLYPDPWHKQRHQKRRFVSKATIDHFHRILRTGSQFRFASDIEDYVWWVVKNISQHGGFKWTGTTIADWRSPPVDWHSTRYEAKALREGRTPTYITFTRQ